MKLFEGPVTSLHFSSGCWPLQ